MFLELFKNIQWQKFLRHSVEGTLKMRDMKMREKKIREMKMSSLSCWTCTEVTELLNCLNGYVKLT